MAMNGSNAWFCGCMGAAVHDGHAALDPPRRDTPALPVCPGVEMHTALAHQDAAVLDYNEDAFK